MKREFLIVCMEVVEKYFCFCSGPTWTVDRDVVMKRTSLGSDLISDMTPFAELGGFRFPRTLVGIFFGGDNLRLVRTGHQLLLDHLVDAVDALPPRLLLIGRVHLGAGLLGTVGRWLLAIQRQRTGRIGQDARHLFGQVVEYFAEFPFAGNLFTRRSPALIINNVAFQLRSLWHPTKCKYPCWSKKSATAMMLDL